MRELEISHSIGKLITSLLDLDELLTRIVEASVDITGAEEGYLLLVDEGTGELYLRAGQNLTEEHAQGFRVKVHDSIAGSVVKTGKPEIAESKEGKSLKIKTGYQVKALLNVPLKVREKVIGVLGVNNKVSDKAFSEDNLHMLSVLADYAAIAIEKARLFSQLTEAKERLNGLIASSLNAVIAIDQGKKITLFNRRAEDMLGWTAKEMEGQSVARLHVDFGKAQEIHEVVNREGTIVGWEIVLKHKDGTRIPALLSATLIRDDQGNPIGQAGFIRDRCQVNLLEERLRAFVGVSQAIIGVLELDEVLDLIVKSAVAVFPAAQSGAIHLYDKRADILRVRANTHDYSVEAIEALSLRAGEGIAGWVFQNQQPLVVNDAGQDPRYKRIDHPEVQDHKSMICMPLRVKEKVIGALTLSTNYVTGAFQAEDLGLLSTFASQAAVAIVNAELMTKNRERLRKLEMLSRASNEMMSNLRSLGLDDRLNLIVRHAAQILDAETSTIFLVKRPGFLSKEASHGHRKGGFHKGREFAIRSGKGTGLIGHIAYTGELFNAHGDDLVGHWATTGRAPDHVASGKCCSLLGIPLKRQLGDTQELVGLLDVENKKDTDGQPKSHIGFSKEDEWILSIFAETVVICLENAELYERTSDRLEKKVATLKAIQETSAAISAELDLDELLELITEKAAAVFAAPAASLMLWDNREENLAVRAKHGLTDEYTQQRVPREKVDDAIALMGELRPFPTVDLRSTPFGRLDLVEAEHLCSVLSAPLAVSGRLIGILDIYSKDEPRQFTADEIEVVEVLASQAAVAIRNAQLYEETIRRANALEALYEAGKTVTGTLALDEILSRIVEQAWRITGRYSKQARFSDLALKEGHRLKFKAACPPEYLLGLQQALGDIDLEYDERIGIKGRVVKTGRSQLVGDVTQDLDYVQYDPETRSELAVPIKLGKEVIGVINVEHPDCNAFDEDDRRNLESLAAQAAVAIENARLYEREQRRAHEAEAMVQVGQAISSTLDLDKIMETVAQNALLLLGLENSQSTILLIDEKTGDFVRLTRVPPRKNGNGPRPRDGLSSLVIETGQPIVIPDVRRDSRVRASVVEEGVRSLIGVPLKVKERTIGVLFANTLCPRDFTQRDIEMLSSLANEAAVAIENARLYVKQQQEAKQLAVINQIAAEISSTLDLDKILQTLVNELAWVIGVEQCAIAIFDERGEHGDVVAEYLEEGCVPSKGIRIPLRDNAAVELVRKTKRPLVVKDAQRDPIMEKVWDIMKQRRTQSIMIVPIVIGDRVIGTIGLDAVSGHREFTEEEKWLAETIAYHAAIAIQNSRQFRLREGLLKAGEVVTAEGELYPALEVIAQSVKETIGCDVVCLYTYDEKKREISYPSVVVGKLHKPQERADWRLVSQERKLRVDLLGERSVIGTLFEHGSSRFAFCSTKDPILGAGEFAAREGIESSAGILLKIGQEVVGVLFVNYRFAHRFSDEEKRAAELFAVQAALTIQSARRYEELKKIKGFVGARTAVDWMRMVSTAWGHGIRREVSTALGHMALLRGLLAQGESAQEVEKELDRLENVIKGIKEIPITAPLSHEDAVDSVQINDLVKTYLERQWKHVRYRPVKLYYELQEDLDSIATVRASRQWLRRALEILVDNSVQAMLEADSLEKRLMVTTRLVGKTVETSVKDTGPGISKGVLEKLFEEPIDKPVGSRGAGIGLMLARTIVQTYGGDIRVEPPGERGTNMVIVLPVEN